MKRLRILLFMAILVAFLPPVLLPGGSIYIPAEFQRPIKLNSADTFTIVTHYNINVDTVLRRPLYKMCDSFLERMIDSFSRFPSINSTGTLFPNPMVADQYIISTRFEYILPESSFSLDSIIGVYASSQYKLRMPIYNVNDSVLSGFGIDKSNDSINVRFWRPEFQISCSYRDYYLFINAKKRESERYELMIYQHNTPIDLKSCDYFKWVTDVIESNDSTACDNE